MYAGLMPVIKTRLSISVDPLESASGQPDDISDDEQQHGRSAGRAVADGQGRRPRGRRQGVVSADNTGERDVQRIAIQGRHRDAKETQ